MVFFWAFKETFKRNYVKFVFESRNSKNLASLQCPTNAGTVQFSKRLCSILQNGCYWPNQHSLLLIPLELPPLYQHQTCTRTLGATGKFFINSRTDTPRIRMTTLHVNIILELSRATQSFLIFKFEPPLFTSTHYLPPQTLNTVLTVDDLRTVFPFSSGGSVELVISI